MRQGWDLFLSAYNDNERVQKPFEGIFASRKCWWPLPEYNYQSHELPSANVIEVAQQANESEFIGEGLASSGFSASSGQSVCIDITGFMRPHILYFLKYLKEAGLKQIDMIYTEPEHYSRKAETTFSIDDVVKVRSVLGYEGQHVPGMDGDALIVGVGYDHGLMSRVILEKESARLIQLHCFPSLSADMYHESILRLDRVASASKARDHEYVIFSSANDPFVTAAELSRAYAKLKGAGLSNLYLSPLATKPHTLGFGLFYLRELEGTASSLIFPFSARYSRETGKGLGRSWVYPIIF
ncbi:hypothetical protein [Rhodopseudomonas palustris]|nr:hypothetical protein [Rhodopseudomonas palustris]